MCTCVASGHVIYIQEMLCDTSLPIMGEVYIFILMCSFDIIEIPFDTSLPIVEEVYICRLIFFIPKQFTQF